MKKGKKYQAVVKLIDSNKLYTIAEACELVKQTSTVKFDATIGVSFRLNVDPRQADQQIRGTLILPHGNGKLREYLQSQTKLKKQKLPVLILSVVKNCLKKFKKKTGLISISSSLHQI